MTSRRDLLIGATCVAAAGAAFALKPRRNVTLLQGVTLAEVVPMSFGAWRSEDIGDPLAINGPGTLSAKLYNELVVRRYSNDRGDSILLLLAYGGQQTDELQLHRPEICYPAFGYDLVENEAIQLPVGRKVRIPARRLLAQADSQKEAVIYWSRMGEFLPSSASEQRQARLDIALDGIIPDGLLSRFSTVASSSGNAWSELEAFVPQLLAAIAPRHRGILIGTARANALRSEG